MSAVIAPPLAAPASDRNLWIGIGVSLALHALFLSLHFQFPDASRAFRDKALDIILVNSKSAQKPHEAQALAQTNLDGGGNTAEDRRAKTPLPPSKQQKSGTELEQAQKKVQALEARQQRLLAQAKAKKSVKPETEAEAQPEPEPAVSGRDLASNALAMARLEAEISRTTDEYNKRPWLKTLSPRTLEDSGAFYLASWVSKVEKVGTLNFPRQANKSMYGVLQVWVVLNASDGSVADVEIRKTSGNRSLDSAAIRIIRMGEPYGAMPKTMLLDGDKVAGRIGFSRILEFTNDQLVTKSK